MSTAPHSAAPDQVTINVRNFNDPPSCELAMPSLDMLWPPDHAMTQVEILGVMDLDSVHNVITLKIVGVTQDEPIDGLGDGDSSPDAAVQGHVEADTVLLRSERSGTGNGRVYEVVFEASDGFEFCEHPVRVQVPHDRKDTATNSGQIYDSTHP